MKIARAAWLSVVLLTSVSSCDSGGPLSVSPDPTPPASSTTPPASSTTPPPPEPPPHPTPNPNPPPPPGVDAGAPVDAPVKPPPPVPSDAGPPMPTPASCQPSSPSAMQADGTCVRNAFKRNGNVCVCQAATPVVCGSACTDLQSDDDNCGCCGNRCPATSACNLGKCGPVPTLVEPSPAMLCRGLELAIDNSTLYWANIGDGTIQRASTAGGPPKTLAASENDPRGILVRGGNVFWMGRTPGNPAVARSIRVTSTNGGGVSVLGTSPTGYGGITVAPDGATIYSSAGNSISRQLMAGAPVVVGVEITMGVPRALALDGTKLAFPTDINGDVDVIDLVPGQVASCGASNDLGNGQPIGFLCSRLARSQGSLGLTSIFIQAGQVVWSDGSNIKMNPLFPVVQANVAIVAADAMIRGMAMLPKGLVFSSYDDVDPTSGVVGQAPLMETLTIIPRLARHQNAPGSIVTDGVRAYWATGDCQIFSAPLR
jgi:hypothetical protein